MACGGSSIGMMQKWCGGGVMGNRTMWSSGVVE